MKIEPTMTPEEIATWVPGVTGFAKPHPAQPIHGTLSGYQYHGCRCDDCKAANAASFRRWRTTMRGTEPRKHGIVSAYTHYRCRCDACVEAARQSWREYRERRMHK